MQNTTSAPTPRQMLLVRLLFFLQYSGIGVFISFITVFLRERGLSGFEIGALSMLSSLASLIFASVWGYLSDRSGRPRLILAIGALGAALVTQLYLLAQSVPAFLLVATLYGIFNSSSAALVDSLALSMLGERREEYGRYRLGGTFGYILSTATSGLLFERTGLWAVLPTFGIINLLFAGTALFLPARSVRLKTRGGTEVLKMIRQPRWLALVSGIFLVWIASSSAFSFLNITLKELGAPDSLIGITFSVSAMAEMPFMAFYSSIVRRVNPVRLFWFAMLGYLARFILYSRMTDPSLAIIAHLIVGPCYVLLWNSAVTIANRMAPPELSGTAQGLIISATSLAGVLSALISGWLFDRFGASGMFAIMGNFVLAGFIVFGFSIWRGHWKTPPPG